MRGQRDANHAWSSYAYNPASQLTSRWSNTDAYAFNGYVNVNRPYATNGLNQYTSAGPASFAYDANGNLTSDSATTFTYDVENRLVAARGARNVDLAYDPLGRLWQVSGGPSGTTRFLYDGDALVAEYDQWGNMQRRYVHGQGADTPQVWFEGAGTSASVRRYLFTNHQGSVTAIADGNGNAIAINRYDEYGIPGSGNIGRFQYTGQAWLEDLGMYHYKARIYSPTLGRFLQTDPIGYEDQINLYAYVGNDPVNNSDPSGLCTTGSRVGIDASGCRSIMLGGGLSLGGRWERKDYPVTTESDGTTVISSSMEWVSYGFFDWSSLSQGSPQSGQCKKMDPRLAKGREFFGSLSNWSGNAANGLALAGAVPTPATPALQATAVVAKGLSLVATGSQLMLDGVHYARTGDARPFATDFGSAVLGAIPAGRLAGSLTGHAGAAPGGAADKFGQAATDALYGAASGSVNLGC